jgi:hypothetical protein
VLLISRRTAALLQPLRRRRFMGREYDGFGSGSGGLEVLKFGLGVCAFVPFLFTFWDGVVWALVLECGM